MKSKRFLTIAFVLCVLAALFSGCEKPAPTAQEVKKPAADVPAVSDAQNEPLPAGAQDGQDIAGVAEAAADSSEPTQQTRDESGGEPDNPAVWLLGREKYAAFEKTASALGLSVWDAAPLYCTALTELGDGAGFTYTDRVMAGDGTLCLDVARLRSRCYDESQTTLAGKVASQYEYFLNNQGDVLGPSRARNDGEELIYNLTGLTVFHPALSGAGIRVTVNDVDCGEFALADGEICTLIPLDLPEFVADRPVHIELGPVNLPESAEIEVYPGLDSNVSRGI